jgi:hypothetical protein
MNTIFFTVVKIQLYEMACNKIIGWGRRKLLSGEALNLRAPASVFKDKMVEFYFIAASKTAGH